MIPLFMSTPEPGSTTRLPMEESSVLVTATIVPSDDGTYAWLFFTNALPGTSTITVTVDGSTIRTATGAHIDAAGTGTVGSKLTFNFTTVSESFVPGTTITGIVADPGPDLTPNTPDDVQAGPDGVLMTGDDVYRQYYRRTRELLRAT